MQDNRYISGYTERERYFRNRQFRSGTGYSDHSGGSSTWEKPLQMLFELIERPLQAHWRMLYLDGIHFSVRHGDKADAIMILVALGVDLEGNKEVLALRACAEESKDGWACLLRWPPTLLQM